MMRRSAGFGGDKARRQLLKEWYDVPALELTANDYITCRVNSVDLKNRLRDIETDCRDRLHVWLLRIVGASTAPTSMALPCRWRSRPHHQNETSAPFHSIPSRARASSVAAENADNGPGLLRARGLRTEDRFRRRTTESQDERAPSLTRIKGVFRSRAASSPAAPIYF